MNDLDHATSQIAIAAMIPPRRDPGEGFKHSWPPIIMLDAAFSPVHGVSVLITRMERVFNP